MSAIALVGTILGLVCLLIPVFDYHEHMKIRKPVFIIWPAVGLILLVIAGLAIYYHAHPIVQGEYDTQHISSAQNLRTVTDKHCIRMFMVKDLCTITKVIEIPVIVDMENQRDITPGGNNE